MKILDVKGNTEEDNEHVGKWKGYVTASIAASLDKTWRIGSDFSGLHKFVPIVEVCERLKGCNRTPGCLRFYIMDSATGLPGGKRKAWERDRLLEIEEEAHSYTYAVEGSNMNLENCVVSFKAVDGKDGATVVRWSWEVDPVKKSTRERTLSDMSELGCTFIKGIEAAAASTDSIDFDFEGSPLPTICGDAGEDCTNLPALSLMKSRLETLTHILSELSHKLEENPTPTEHELESLQCALAKGRHTFVKHMDRYMNDVCASQSMSIGSSHSSQNCNEYRNENLSEEHEEAQDSTTRASCRARRKSTKRGNQPTQLMHISEKGKSRVPNGELCQKSQAKCNSVSEEDLLIKMDHASQGACEAFQDFSNQFHSDLHNDISHQLKFVEAQLEAVDFQMQEAINAGVTDETLRILPHAPRNQNNGSRLGVIVGDKKYCTSAPEDPSKALKVPNPKMDLYHSPQSIKNKMTLSPPSLEAQISPSPQSKTPNQDRSHSSQSIENKMIPSQSKTPKQDRRHSPQSIKSKMTPPSLEAKMAPTQTKTPHQDRQGAFGVWELNNFRNRRLQGSLQDIDSVRFRSSQIYEDLVEGEMSQDLKRRSKTHRTSNFKNQKVIDMPIGKEFIQIGESSDGSEKQRCGVPKSSTSKNLQAQTLPHASCSQKNEACPKFLESPRLRSGQIHTSLLQDENTHTEGEIETGGPQHIRDLDVGSGYKNLIIENTSIVTVEVADKITTDPSHRPFIICRGGQGPRGNKNSLLRLQEGALPDRSCQEFSPANSCQKLEGSSKGWGHRGSKLSRTAQHLDTDLIGLQLLKKEMRQGGPHKFEDKDFDKCDSLRRPARLPLDIWPNFVGGDKESDNYKNLQNQGQNRIVGSQLPLKKITQVELESECKNNVQSSDNRFETLRLGSPTTNTRDIVKSRSPLQNSKDYEKFLQVTSFPTRFPVAGEPMPQMVADGSRLTIESSLSTQNKSPFKVDSEVANSFPLSKSSCGLQVVAFGSPSSSGTRNSYGSSSPDIALDLGKEIAPGVFHCRQGNQTRVIVNIPEDIEARENDRRHLCSLLRRKEIYKEFTLLGVQNPPTEDEILDDFAIARAKNQDGNPQTCTLGNFVPILHPYYAEGKVRVPQPAETSSIAGKLQPGMDSVDNVVPKFLSGQLAGFPFDEFPIDAQFLSGESASPLRRSPSGQMIKNSSQNKKNKPLNVKDTFQTAKPRNSETNKSFEKIREENLMDHKELVAQDCKRAQTSYRIKREHKRCKGSKTRAHAFSSVVEGSTSQHASQKQKKESLTCQESVAGLLRNKPPPVSNCDRGSQTSQKLMKRQPDLRNYIFLSASAPEASMIMDRHPSQTSGLTYVTEKSEALVSSRRSDSRVVRGSNRPSEIIDSQESRSHLHSLTGPGLKNLAQESNPSNSILGGSMNTKQSNLSSSTLGGSMHTKQSIPSSSTLGESMNSKQSNPSSSTLGASINTKHSNPSISTLGGSMHTKQSIPSSSTLGVSTNSKQSDLSISTLGGSMHTTQSIPSSSTLGVPMNSKQSNPSSSTLGASMDAKQSNLSSSTLGKSMNTKQQQGTVVSSGIHGVESIVGNCNKQWLYRPSTSMTDHGIVRELVKDVLQQPNVILHSSHDHPASMAKIPSKFPCESFDLIQSERLEKGPVPEHIKSTSRQYSLDQILLNMQRVSQTTKLDNISVTKEVLSENSPITQLVDDVLQHSATDTAKSTNLNNVESNIAMDIPHDNIQGPKSTGQNPRPELLKNLEKKDEGNTAQNLQGPGAILDGMPVELDVHVSLTNETSQSSLTNNLVIERAPFRKIHAISKILDGMPQDWNDDASQQNSHSLFQMPNKMPQELARQKSHSLSAIMNKVPQELEGQESQQCQNFVAETISDMALKAEEEDSELTQSHIPNEEIVLNYLPKTYCDVQTQTELLELTEFTIPRLRSSQNFQSQRQIDKASRLREFGEQTEVVASEIFQTSRPQRPKNTEKDSELGLEDFLTSQSTQMLESVAGIVETNNVNKNSYTSQTMDNEVQKIGEKLNINALQLEAQLTAEGSKNRQKSHVQRLKDNEHETDSEVLPEGLRTRQSAQIMGAMLNVVDFTNDNRSYGQWLEHVTEVSGGNKDQSYQDYETQTSSNESQQSKGSKRDGEPQFREDSAANFLATVALQILNEFSVVQDTEVQDLSDRPIEPQFREYSATNFLNEISQQIVQEFTDHEISSLSQTPNQSEGPMEPRFHEAPALNFLNTLSDKIQQEFKNCPTQEKSDGGGSKYRESSAIDFLGALKEQILQWDQPFLYSGLPNSGQYKVQGEILDNILQGSEQPMETTKDQSSLTESLNNQLQLEDVDSMTNYNSQTQMLDDIAGFDNFGKRNMFQSQTQNTQRPDLKVSKLRSSRGKSKIKDLNKLLHELEKTVSKSSQDSRARALNHIPVNKSEVGPSSRDHQTSMNHMPSRDYTDLKSLESADARPHSDFSFKATLSRQSTESGSYDGQRISVSESNSVTMPQSSDFSYSLTSNTPQRSDYSYGSTSNTTHNVESLPWTHESEGLNDQNVQTQLVDDISQVVDKNDVVTGHNSYIQDDKLESMSNNVISRDPRTLDAIVLKETCTFQEIPIQTGPRSSMSEGAKSYRDLKRPSVGEIKDFIIGSSSSC